MQRPTVGVWQHKSKCCFGASRATPSPWAFRHGIDVVLDERAGFVCSFFLLGPCKWALVSSLLGFG